MSKIENIEQEVRNLSPSDLAYSHSAGKILLPVSSSSRTIAFVGQIFAISNIFSSVIGFGVDHFGDHFGVQPEDFG